MSDHKYKNDPEFQRISKEITEHHSAVYKLGVELNNKFPLGKGQRWVIDPRMIWGPYVQVDQSPDWYY